MFARGSPVFASVVLMLLPLSVLRADVTLRYKTEIKMNPTLPQVAAVVKTGADAMPRETAVRLKNGKGFQMSAGPNWITDFTAKEVTCVDTAGKRYAKLAYDQFVEMTRFKPPEMPAAVRDAMASLKASVSPARLTGRTGVIQGVEAEEREIVYSVDAPGLPNVPPGPLSRVVWQVWTAKPGEVLRVPAIRESTGYALWAYATMNPAAGMDEILKQMPGLSEGYASLAKEMQKWPTMLRTHVEIFVPSVAVALERMPAGSNPPGAGFDPNAPVMQVDEEAIEISSESLPDSFFQVPEGYQEAPIADLLKGMAAKTQTASTVTVPRTPPETAPVIIPEIASPRSREEAANLVKLGRQAHDQGESAVGDAYFRKAIEFADSGATAYALVALGLGSFPKDKPTAASYFERAFRADSAGPMAGTALTWMAHMREDDDPHTAESLYDQALGLEPASSPNRAFTLEMLARFDTQRAALLDDTTQAAQALDLAAEARRIRAQHVAEMFAQRKPEEPSQRVGGGVGPLKLVAKREPQYTRAARVLKVSGTVVLAVVVDVDGLAHDFKLIKGLGYGLDEAAATAVSQWRFEAGQRNGVPVPVLATIEVNFRLL
jgi:TonB family protein